MRNSQDFSVREIVLLLAAVVALLAAVAASAQVLSNLCGTNRGICSIGGAGPVGAPCACGPDRGRLIYPPPNFSDACGTRFGVCHVPFAPIGSPCSCGPDAGQIIRTR